MTDHPATLRLANAPPGLEVAKRLLIVGRRSFSDLLADRLERIGAFLVVGLAEDLSEGRKKRDFYRPNLSLVDPAVCAGSAFDAMLEVVAEHEHGPIAVLTSEWTRLTAMLALDANLRGFLLTDDPLDELLENLKRIGCGEPCFSRQIERELTRENGRPRLRRPSELAELTEREMIVLRQLAAGASVKEVAGKLDITYKAADSVKFRMMQKLHIHNRIDLVRLAIREGLAVA